VGRAVYGVVLHDRLRRALLRGTAARGKGKEVVQHVGVDGGQRIQPASVPLRGLLGRRQLFQGVQLGKSPQDLQRRMQARLDT